MHKQAREDLDEIFRSSMAIPPGLFARSEEAKPEVVTSGSVDSDRSGMLDETSDAGPPHPHIDDADPALKCLQLISEGPAGAAVATLIDGSSREEIVRSLASPIDPLDLHEVLSRGSFGVIYSAMCPRLGAVVVKQVCCNLVTCTGISQCALANLT